MSLALSNELLSTPIDVFPQSVCFIVFLFLLLLLIYKLGINISVGLLFNNTFFAIHGKL